MARRGNQRGVGRGAIRLFRGARRFAGNLRTSAARQWRQWFGAKTLGQRGESIAVRYLRRRRYTIVGRGSHVRRGEIDVVAVDGKTVVFVEVKTRRSHDRGHPAEAVGREKQYRLTKLALVYLKRHGLLEFPARFDVVAITWPKDARRPTIEHIKNAFEPVSHGQLFA